MLARGRNRQALGESEKTQIRFSHYKTSLNSALNGTGSYTSIFVDFEKAFNSIHRDSLWCILRAYGIPLHIVQIINSFYHNFNCSTGSSSLNF